MSAEIDRIFKESQERLEKQIKADIDHIFGRLLVVLVSFSILCFIVSCVCLYLGHR